jgi:ferredoxin
MAHIISDKCVGCGTCAPFCPLGAVSQGEDGFYDVDVDVCVDCGECEKVCPVQAISAQTETKEAQK